MAGCGGLICDSMGSWVCGFFKSLGICNAFVAELWGVLECLNLTSRKGFAAVELCVDSEVVIKSLQRGTSVTMAV